MKWKIGAGRAINLPDLAARLSEAVIDVQVAKALSAVETNATFCVGGGVTANPRCVRHTRKLFGKKGVRVTVPPMSVCGDNAAMIAVGALRDYRAGLFSPLTLDAKSKRTAGRVVFD